MQAKQIDMATMPFGRRHAWVVFVASLGQLIGTGVATLAGIIIPLLNIMSRPELSSFMQGLIGAMDLVGIVFGSVIFGKLTDKYGYILFFRLCPALVLVASVIAVFCHSETVLIISLFFIGFGIGGEYSLDSNYISELMPDKWKSFMVGLAKAASAFGNILVAGVCWLLLNYWRSAEKWPDLMWIVAVISGVMLISRIWFYQSPKWLESHGQPQKAQLAVEKFLGKDVVISKEDVPSSVASETNNQQKNNAGGSFFWNNWKKIVLTGIPWACEGLGVYGIGVFLPILIMSLGIEHVSPSESPIMHVDSSVAVTFFISCIILPGFLIGIWLIKRKNNVCDMQVWGFIACAVCLVILLLAYNYKWSTWISILAFMGFELFLNIGPHLVTFVLPPKVFPIEVRGFGTGIAASLGKVGAVAGVFFIPVLLDFGGSQLVLIVSAIVMLVGALITYVFAKMLGLTATKEAASGRK